MLYCDIVFYNKWITKEKEKKYIDSMTFAAFTAWLSGAGDKADWQTYCRKLGLVEKQKKINKETKKRIAKRSLEIADRILKMGSNKVKTK